MKIQSNSVNQYLDQLPEDRRAAVEKILEVLRQNLPAGFKEVIGYNMPSFVVPHELYPPGYHCTPALPLPFISVASQKNFVALYHSGIYADPEVSKWWQTEYAKHCKYKLDMGKSCTRFKKMDDIPYDLIAELATKFTPESWIELYERNVAKIK